jgi:long-chain acyl-CoA synthetase
MTHPSIHARAHPNRIAYRMAAAAKAISYREFDELSNQGAHLFRALGLTARDHIGLLMENRLAFGDAGPRSAAGSSTPRSAAT